MIIHIASVFFLIYPFKAVWRTQQYYFCKTPFYFSILCWYRTERVFTRMRCYQGYSSIFYPICYIFMEYFLSLTLCSLIKWGMCIFFRYFTAIKMQKIFIRHCRRWHTLSISFFIVKAQVHWYLKVILDICSLGR